MSTTLKIELSTQHIANRYYILYNNLNTGAFFVKTTNCKVTIFQNFNSLIYNVKKTNPDITVSGFKNIFINILKLCDITVLFDITNNGLLPYLLENFEYYYAIQIPTGYGKDPTTMVCLKNLYTDNKSYHKYLLDKSLVNSL